MHAFVLMTKSEVRLARKDASANEDDARQKRSNDTMKEKTNADAKGAMKSGMLDQGQLCE